MVDAVHRGMVIIVHNRSVDMVVVEGTDTEAVAEVTAGMVGTDADKVSTETVGYLHRAEGVAEITVDQVMGARLSQHTEQHL